MSENITIESQSTDDPATMRLLTNLSLTADDEVETYDSPQAGEEGSPVAQALFMAYGLQALHLAGSQMLVTRAPGVEWHDLLDDLRAVLVDFFL